MQPSSIKPSKFVLIIGNSRSGTTIVSSIVDSHPRMICASETVASFMYWRGLDRDQIVAEIISNSVANYASGRLSSGYEYRIQTAPKIDERIDVIADKVWIPTLLLLAGAREMIATLSERLQCSMMLIHCVRNPFDVISTMRRHSGETLRNRFRWYTMHCEAAQMLIERQDIPIHLIRHEQLLASPTTALTTLFQWLGHELAPEHSEAIKDRLFRDARLTRTEVEWDDDLVEDINAMIRRFEFLRGYEESVGTILQDR